MKKVTFWVSGVPVPKGSMKAFMRPGMKFPVVTNDNLKSKPWASSVSYSASEQVAAGRWRCIEGGAVSLRLTFAMPRPRGHYGTGLNDNKLRKSAPTDHTKKPDLDKLARCVGDALKGIMYADDSQVVSMSLKKNYGLVGMYGVAIELTTP